MSLYDRAVSTAQRLIKKYGQNSVTWVRKGDPVQDPASPWKASSGGETNQTVNIAFIPTSSKKTSQYERGNVTHIGGFYGLMGAVDFEPNIKDVVIRDLKELSISKISKLNPSGQTVLYKIWFEL